jgi:hypothetical protein
MQEFQIGMAHRRTGISLHEFLVHSRDHLRRAVTRIIDVTRRCRRA